MNLEELRMHKKHLKMERYLCFAMAFVMTLGLNGSLKKKGTENNDVPEITIESTVETNLTSSNSVTVDDKQFGMDQIDFSKSVMMTKSTISQGIAIAREQVETIIIEPRELTCEEKIAAICERDGYTYEELDMVLAGCVAESCEDGNNYDECYHVASTFYNRTHDVLYVNDINNIYGENTGYSVYYQFIAPNQFSVYSNGSYKKYLGRTDLLGYQAAVDMFYSCEPSHDYLNFNYIPPRSGSYERLVPTGNYYSRHQKPEHVIEDELVRELVLTLN